MTKRMTGISLGLAGGLLLAFILVAPFANATMVTSQSDPIPFTPKLSIPNKVPDFYAQGTSSGYTLKITSKGGYLTSGDWSVFFTPWDYVTTQWSIGTVYIIFLANTTASDFYIGYLYVTNSSSPVILRTFHYETGSLNMLTFDGTHYVSTHFVTIPPQNMPKLNLSPEAKINNQLSAIGPEIYLNGNAGTLMNSSAILDIYPLMNQLYQGKDDYNELWALLVDSVGNDYFAILYMQNSDHDHLIMAHSVRLNDLNTVSGKTLDARWTNELFRFPLTVTLPAPNATVRVDGFPFQVVKRGVSFASVYLPAGTASVEVPDKILSDPGTQLAFSSWESHGNQNPLTIEVGSPVELVAHYKTEYRLSVVTPQGKAESSGWYDAGSNATFSAPAIVDFNNGTREVFTGWTGDYTGHSAAGSVVMNSPKQILAAYKTQHQVRLQLTGAPANASLTLRVNNSPYQLNGTTPIDLWVESNARLTLDLQTTQIQGSSSNYNFAGFQLNNQPATSPITITRPSNLAIVFSNTPKIQGSIRLTANQAMQTSGYAVSISGSVNSAGDPTIVSLSYSKDKTNWQTIATITTNQDGTFAYTWRPGGAGSYFIRASWSGDTNHMQASQEIPVDVRGISLPSSGSVGNIIGNFAAEARKLPVVSTLAELATALLLFGVALAGLLVPSSSPIIGYFIGSLLVGFVFVFPVSAILLSVKAATSRRSPSALWLTPLATVWFAALGILSVAGTLVPAGLIEASLILMIASNALFIPLVFSLLLARTVAR